jgi:hypothetical protein
MGRAEDLFERLKQGGELAIDDLIAERQSEEMFLDFKRSADKGGGRRLNDQDRRNIARAISGFGNSEGGVIVWGIDCRERAGSGDLPGEKIEIENPKRFVSWLEGAVSGCTIPAHPGVQHHAIETGVAGGFAVSYVPKSFLAPHQTVQGQQNYYIRAGSNFVPVPHGVLAGLFGRAPQPVLCHSWLTQPVQIGPGMSAKYQARVGAGLAIRNRGLGIARDVYLNFELWQPGKPSNVAWGEIRRDWLHESFSDTIVSMTSDPAFRLAPGAHVMPVDFTVVLEEPFGSSLIFRLSYGSANSPLMSFEKKAEVAELQDLYDASRTLERDALNQLFWKGLFPPSGIAPPIFQ